MAILFGGAVREWPHYLLIHEYKEDMTWILYHAPRMPDRIKTVCNETITGLHNYTCINYRNAVQYCESVFADILNIPSGHTWYYMCDHLLRYQNYLQGNP